MLTKLTQEQADYLWGNMWQNADYFDKGFKQHVPDFLSLFVSKIVNEGQVDIGIATRNSRITAGMIMEIEEGAEFGFKGKLASFLSYDEHNMNDSRLELYYTKDGKITIYLYIGFFDEKEYSHVLTPDEIKMIPEGLINQMKKALQQEEILIVQANMLEH